ncbi:MAG TPA: DUF4296 domain-containing protein [Puia sp.]|nr:DUF4296 domain-containing protein [Puia sp.]
MTKSLFILVLTGCFLSACVHKDSLPKGIISKNEMQKILWDMIQADQFSKQFLSKDSTKNINLETMKLYDEVFQVYHISKDDFKKSYQFYISRPDIFKVVLDSISAQASRRMKEVYEPAPIKNIKNQKPMPQ